jgi:hypothetical protein
MQVAGCRLQVAGCRLQVAGKKIAAGNSSKLSGVYFPENR